MILGLDISTKTVGASIVNISTNEVLYCQPWRLDFARFKKRPFLKLQEIEKNLIHISENYNIKHIAIEKFLMRFSPGKSSAQTLITGAGFNKTIQWQCFKIFGIEPILINASSARKLCGIRVKRGENAKEKVLEKIVDIVPNFVVEYKRTGPPKEYIFDMADSIVIAKAGIKLLEKNEV